MSVYEIVAFSAVAEMGQLFDLEEEIRGVPMDVLMAFALYSQDRVVAVPRFNVYRFCCGDQTSRSTIIVEHLSCRMLYFSTVGNHLAGSFVQFFKGALNRHHQIWTFMAVLII